MRKTDKAARTNKPPKAKVEGGGIGTLKPTKEELAETKKLLKHAQKLAINKDVKKIEQGFSYEFEKFKKLQKGLIQNNSKLEKLLFRITKSINLA